MPNSPDRIPPEGRPMTRWPGRTDKALDHMPRVGDWEGAELPLNWLGRILAG